MRMGFEIFGWKILDIQALNGLSMKELKHRLKCIYSKEEGWR